MLNVVCKKFTFYMKHSQAKIRLYFAAGLLHSLQRVLLSKVVCRTVMVCSMKQQLTIMDAVRDENSGSDTGSCLSLAAFPCFFFTVYLSF